MRKINFDCPSRFDGGKRFGFDVLKQKFLIRRAFKIKTHVKEKIVQCPVHSRKRILLKRAPLPCVQIRNNVCRFIRTSLALSPPVLMNTRWNRN